MYRIFWSLGLLLCGFNLISAQVKIGENPQQLDLSSILELESATKALVLSRMSTAQMSAIAPLDGAIVYNTTEECVFYYDGGEWNNLCEGGGAGVTFVDNTDGTFTIDIGNGPITFNGGEETTSTLIENSDGTYTYTNEEGVQTVVSISGGENVTTFVDNADGTFTINIGNGPITFNGAEETTSTLIENTDGTYTYTNEEGVQTVVSISGAENLSTLVDNADGSYTYTNEAGEETLIVTSAAGNHTGATGSVFFASDNGFPTENNAELFWDNVNNRLGIGTNSPASTLEVNGPLRVTGRINNNNGSPSFPGYHFFNNSGSGMFGDVPGEMGLSASGQELVRLSSDARVGILEPNPQATLHVGGDLIVDGTITAGSGPVAKNAEAINQIRRESSTVVALGAGDKTIILEATVEQLMLPLPNASNKGQIYIIKDLGGKVTQLSMSYQDRLNNSISEIPSAQVLWLQSDGVEWHQIN